MKRMRRWGRWTAVLLLAFGAAGCAWMAEPYRETARYDLALPAPAALPDGGEATVRPLVNLTGLGRNLVFRSADGRLTEDAYTDWAQTPERLIQSYLARAFGMAASGTAAYEVEIGGTLFSFELDTAKRQAVLGMRYELQLRRPDRPVRRSAGTVLLTAPLAAEDGAAASAAMSVCAAGLAERLRADAAALAAEKDSTEKESSR